jgi:hypothetical protein
LSSKNFDFLASSLWPSGTPLNCDSQGNYLFVQYTCEHVPEDQAARYSKVSLIIFMGILISMIFMIWLRMAFQGSKVKALEFDITTLTAGDYTVEMPISSNDYKFWLNADRDGYIK